MTTSKQTQQQAETNAYFAEQYGIHASRYGLQKEWLHQTFQVGDQHFSIDGLLPDAPSKACVIVRDTVTGMIYKCSAVQVAMKMRGELLRAS